MIQAFVSDGSHLLPGELGAEPSGPLVWIDLLQPTRDEEEAVEKLIGVNIPSREDMEEIEISSRLYHDGDASYMTALLPAVGEGDDPEMAPVTFLLAGDQLVTIRYHDPSAFQSFPKRAAKVNLGCSSGDATLVALLDAVIDRLADVLERAGGEIDGISRTIFQRPGAASRSRDFQRILKQIGRKGDLISKIRDSLATLDRLMAFLSQALVRRNKTGREVRDGVKTLTRDVRSLTDHANFLSQKVTFLLDATLGMISIEQNAVIKALSIAAVVFLPPTLIASMYGMNFHFMPELDWPWGYPGAILLMLVSAILPYVFFKRKGWL
jgi:magnesium transporter